MTQRPLPSRASALLFALKCNVLRASRLLQNATSNLHRHTPSSLTDYPLTLAESVTPLWTDTVLSEANLQLGKVQNLRRACSRLNRVALPASATFSFWRQLGPTTRAKGYTFGRMLQEGCIIPSIGGGLCQLSNALYDVCLSAGCEILERHAHSSIIPGSAASLGRDATVAWNYVDFRFRAPIPLLIEAFLRQDDLVVRLRASERHPSMLSSARTGLPFLTSPPKPSAHSCETCGQTSCFRHAAFFVGPRIETKAAFLLDECWPEFRAYIQSKQQPGDLFAHPINGALWHLPRYQCPAATAFSRTATAPMQTLWRSWQSRRASGHVPSRVAAQMSGARAIAQRFSKLLTKDVTTVYVEQSLLPYLWRNMDLGGRTLKVFITRLPLANLHRILDAAFLQHPDRLTLNELRAAPELVEAESDALEYATSVITPHAAIANMFAAKADRLPWDLPASSQMLVPRQPSPNTVAFPGPTVARKGAYELRAAARELNLQVLLLGSELEGPDFWNGVDARRTTFEEALSESSAFLQPALIEDKPRMLLKAISASVPVIATEACSLLPGPGIHIVPAECSPSLLSDVLSRRLSANLL